MSERLETGYATVNGVDVYDEDRGGGPPVVAVHGGYGPTTTFGGLPDELAQRRRVVAVGLRGHGHTPDVDRPFTYESFRDDVASLIEHLGIGPADPLGSSLGAGVCPGTAIQHPDDVRRLACVSFPFRRDAWFPEVRVAFGSMSSAGFGQMRRSPTDAAWSVVAPDQAGFPALLDKTGELQRRPYDWSGAIAQPSMPILLVDADADSIPVTHVAEAFALLGGGMREPGREGEQNRSAARLAIVPDRTHDDVLGSPARSAPLDAFLA